MLVFHGTGTGKTVSAFAIAAEALRKDPAGAVYIYAPAKVVHTAWRTELDNRAANPTNDRMGRDFIYLRQQHAAGRIRFLAHEAMKSEDISDNDTVIIDEAHVFRYGGGKVSKQTETAIQTTYRAKNRFLLTATPVWNSPGEAASLYMMLLARNETPERLRPVLTAYANCFDKAAHEKDDQSISKWWRCLVSSYERPQNDPEFPDVVRGEPVREEMTDEEYRTVYYPAEINRKTDAFINKLRRANNVDSKLAWFERYLREVGLLGEDGRFDPESDHKVVVYSRWLSVMRKVAARLKALGVPTRRINGNTSSEQAKASCVRYNEDLPNKRLPVILLSDAGSAGIELKGTGSLVVWEPQWNVEAKRQVLGRVARKGSHPRGGRVLIRELVWRKPQRYRRPSDTAYDTADEYLLEISRRKEPAVATFYEGIRRASVELEHNRCRTASVTNTFPVWRSTKAARTATASTRDGSRSPARNTGTTSTQVDDVHPLVSIKLKEIPPGTYESSDRYVRPDPPARESLPVTSLPPGVVGKLPRGYVMPWERKRPNISTRDLFPIFFV